MGLEGKVECCLLLLVVSLALAWGQDASTVKEQAAGAHSKLFFGTPTYKYNIPYNTPLKLLPGANELNPRRATVSSITTTLAPVAYTLTVPGTGLIVDYTGPGYVNSPLKVFMFAPTMRVNRGQSYKLTITNALVDPNTAINTSSLYFGPTDTNSHSHGLVDSTGVPNNPLTNLSAITTYTGGDNIFYDLKSRTSTSQTPNTVTFSSTVFDQHLPGLHWHHPHKHGSTTIQVSTAHGLIVINDDNKAWLSDPSCSQLRRVLENKLVEEVMWDITMLFFKWAGPPGDRTNSNNLDKANLQLASIISRNPYCCTNSPPQPAFKGNGTVGQARDIILVNGGFQPIHYMTSNVWQRWRMVFSAAKGFMALNIINKATGQVATDCKLQLLAKDGVYLLQMPRLVPGMIISSGNRLEVLVRCNGSVGTEYQLSAGLAAAQIFSNNTPPFFGNGNLNQQDVLATIKMLRPLPAVLYDAARKSLDPEACTPKRPVYAPDLRDGALVAASLDPNTINIQKVNFSTLRGFGCEVNGDLFPKGPSLVLPVGQVTQWNFNSISGHPMHTHVAPYQVTFQNSSFIPPGNQLTSFFQEGDFYDTYLNPVLAAGFGGAAQGNAAVHFRFQPSHFAGYAVMHCHFLQHEDNGCMKILLMQCPGFPDSQPADGICPNYSPQVPGTI